MGVSATTLFVSPRKSKFSLGKNKRLPKLRQYPKAQEATPNPSPSFRRFSSTLHSRKTNPKPSHPRSVPFFGGFCKGPQHHETKGRAVLLGASEACSDARKG